MLYNLYRSDALSRTYGLGVNNMKTKVTIKDRTNNNTDTLRVTGYEVISRLEQESSPTLETWYTQKSTDMCQETRQLR